MDEEDIEENVERNAAEEEEQTVVNAAGGFSDTTDSMPTHLGTDSMPPSRPTFIAIRVFIRNLPLDFFEDELAEMFPKAVEHRVIRHNNGDSQGYAVAVYHSHMYAEEACKKYHKTEVGDNRITVEIIMSRLEKKKAIEASLEARQVALMTEPTGDVVQRIQLKHIPRNVTAEQLKRFFPKAKQVTVSNREDKGHRGTGVISFHCLEDAEEAVRTKDGMKIEGCSIRMSLMIRRKGRKNLTVRTIAQDEAQASLEAQQVALITEPSGDVVRRIQLKHIPRNVTAEQLKPFFPKAKQVSVSDREDERHCGTSVISFHCLEDAEEAIRTNDGMNIEGCSIRMSLMNRRKRKKNQSIAQHEAQDGDKCDDIQADLNEQDQAPKKRHRLDVS